MADERFLEDELRMKLTLRNIRCPISIAAGRLPKYARKGYSMTFMESVKLFYDWDRRSPEFKEKLIEYMQKEALTADEKAEMYKLMAFID